ncbi:hypothetical protein ACIHEJ_29555 [Streptomyces sp. NPDC052301]|uniref:hypothetical protein n=1 Tax=Streptomyces sp. NPDC052301 TaxID=3365687 RepID=UPI0037CECC2B
MESVRTLVDRADSPAPQPALRLPEPGAPELEQAVPAVLPRYAFLGPAEQGSAERAVGRVAAETVSPCPPGVPGVAPG